MLKSVKDLPKTVQKILPMPAQLIYFGAYNGSFAKTSDDDKDDDGQGHAIAWSAVKKKFHKDAKSGEWVKGASSVKKEHVDAFVEGMVTGKFDDNGLVLAEAYQGTVNGTEQVVLSEDEAELLKTSLDALQEKIDTVRANTLIEAENGDQTAFVSE